MGLATAKALGKFGPVLVGGRNEKRLANAVAKLEADGVEAYGKTVDIADRASLDEFAAYAASIAPLGNVVNAAGVDTGGGDLIVKVNMVGTINFVPALSRRGIGFGELLVHHGILRAAHARGARDLG